MTEHQGISVGPPHGTIGVAVREGTTVLVLAGEVDIEVVCAFGRAVAPGRDEIAGIDAGEVSLLSATAVQLLMDLR